MAETASTSAPARTTAPSLNVWIEALPSWSVICGIFALVFLGSLLSARLLDWTLRPVDSYWNLLADAILHGRLYLIDPPSTYDLTAYQGRWYVSKQPLPGLLALPYVWILGLDRADPLLFSYFFCALNAVLVFLILEKAAGRGWIGLSRAGQLLVVALFAFGTPEYWLGVDGRFWFISQVLTITFAALAVLLVLAKRSAWLVGACLGAAVFSRSNVFVLWPFLLGIAFQIMEEEGRLRSADRRWNWGAVVKWCVTSAAPLIGAVLLTLWYNYARFDNPLDFGDVNINGAAWIINEARKFGMFNLRYLPHNLRVMFLNLPDLKKQFPFADFPIEGLSIFIATPALVFLFRAWKRSWWAVGAWISVALSILLLAMYHNTGAVQFGYRYMLDFIVPLLLLLAYALGKRPGWLFSLLVAGSIAMQVIGLVWFVSLNK